MIKKTTLILILLGLTIIASAQKSEWINFDKRQQLYPASRYFTGFSMSEVDRKTDLGEVYEKLKKNATGNLTNSIQVTVESVSTLNTLEFDKEFHQEFREKLASFSRVELSGIEILTFYEKRKKMAYALAYVKKSEMIIHYQKIINDKKNSISQVIKLAEQYKNSGDNDDALKTYYKCMPLFKEVEQAQTIIILLEASKQGLQEIKDYELQVKKAISQLHKSTQLDLQDVCSFMAFGLKMQTGAFYKGILLASFTFEDTKMGSSFSRRFKKEFEKELINTGNYKISDQSNIPKINRQSPEYIIKGTYWTEGDKLKIIATLRNIKTGKPHASVDGFLPIAWLKKNNISWKPENFAQAHQNMLQFRKDEIVDGNMHLDVWTNKGNESPIFEENDTLGFYIRVSHPCYIRIINYFADGSRVLLVDNEYIGSDKVNKIVRVGEKFLCASPFGAEVLQVNAQTDKFNPLVTEEKWGYIFIVDELYKILQNTRGFKPIKNEDLRAEKRIVVTTMAK